MSRSCAALFEGMLASLKLLLKEQFSDSFSLRCCELPACLCCESFKFWFYIFFSDFKARFALLDPT